jgi:hypothetical protein
MSLKIKIEKEQKLDGKIVFRAYVNNQYANTFLSEEDAMQYMKMIKENYAAGLPTTETILEETI